MKKILLALGIILLTIGLLGCYPFDWNNAPTQQSGNTKWVSVTEEIELYRIKNGFLKGYLTVNGEKKKIYVLIDEGGGFHIYEYSGYRLPENFDELSESEQDSYIDEYDKRNFIEYESGLGNYQKNSFTVTFDKTTYLEPGAKIKFNKVEWTDPPAELMDENTE